MLLAALFAIPLWVTIPGYFAAGVVWALIYLPYAVSKQAKRYKLWRDNAAAGRLSSSWPKEDWPGRTLEEAFQAKNRQGGQALSPEQFIIARDEQNFTERKIIAGFILDIAIWPIRLLHFLVFVGLWKAIKKVFRWLRHFWTNIRKFVRRVFHWLRDFWNNFIVPIYQWVYKYFVSLYQAIIQRANREAIADMAVLNRIEKESK